MTIANGILDASALSSLGAALAPALYRGDRVGLRIGFYGTSITNGSTAANSNLTFTNQTLELLGTAACSAVASGGSIVSGHPGATAAAIAPFLLADVAAGLIDVAVIEEGTNDTPTAISDYAATMLAQFKACKLAGIPIYVLTVFPRGSNASPTAAQIKAIDLMNLWLRLVVPQYGTLIDVHTLMANKDASGFMKAVYDSGDGVHPSSAGHRKIAMTIVTAMRVPVVGAARPALLDGSSYGAGALNIITNPYLYTNSTGWFQQASTGTAPVVTRPADSTGFLQTGNFLELDVDGTSATSSVIYGIAITTGQWAVGDVLALTAKVQLADTSGNWETVGPGGAGTAGMSLKVVDQSAATVSQGPLTGLGYLASAGLYNFGPSWLTFTVPASKTALTLWLSLSMPAGSHFKARIGEVGVINLTTAGLVGVPLAIT